jgi:hypothetical protein
VGVTLDPIAVLYAVTAATRGSSFLTNELRHTLKNADRRQALEVDEPIGALLAALTPTQLGQVLAKLADHPPEAPLGLVRGGRVDGRSSWQITRGEGA